MPILLCSCVYTLQFLFVECIAFKKLFNHYQFNFNCFCTQTESTYAPKTPDPTLNMHRYIKTKINEESDFFVKQNRKTNFMLVISIVRHLSIICICMHE